MKMLGDLEAVEVIRKKVNESNFDVDFITALTYGMSALKFRDSIVHCRECRYYSDKECTRFMEEDPMAGMFSRPPQYMPSPSDFCSAGRRREDKKDD